jgi:hypothetical protein
LPFKNAHNPFKFLLLRVGGKLQDINQSRPQANCGGIFYLREVIAHETETESRH